MISTDVELAVSRLAAGGVVAIPTETVYGLAADASQADAVARVFAIKGRPIDHPVILHLAHADDLADWAADVPPNAVVLAHTCWPGPLTMLVERSTRVGDWITGGRTTVGLRVPAHPLAQQLIEAYGVALAAPSANRFGKVSPTTARHVLDDIGALLDPDRDLILDGGPCEVGVESTIVDLTTSPPQVLRSGAIDADTISRLLDAEIAGASGPARASGMLAKHYAPECTVVAVDDADAARDVADELRSSGRRAGILDRTDDLVLLARSLYADLRAADDSGLDALVVVLPPAEGLGHAIRDRITKAAADSGRDPTSRDG